jgi:hypothetical protein
MLRLKREITFSALTFQDSRNGRLWNAVSRTDSGVGVAANRCCRRSRHHSPIAAQSGAGIGLGGRHRHCSRDQAARNDETAAQLNKRWPTVSACAIDEQLRSERAHRVDRKAYVFKAKLAAS